LPLRECGDSDQTPVPIECVANSTLVKKGAKDAHVSTGGREKDCITVMLTAWCDGRKCKPMIVFKGQRPQPGKVSARRTVAREIQDWHLNGYPSDAVYACNDKAYVYGTELRLHTDKVLLDEISLEQRRSPRIMQYDDYACHTKEPSFHSYLRDHAIEPFMFNGGLTSCIQFLDKSPNRLLKVGFCNSSFSDSY
jgi:hypothetical protein